MSARAPLDLAAYDKVQQALERALADPLATSSAARAAAGCADGHREASRRALAQGGALRRAAEQGRLRVRQCLRDTALPAIDRFFAGLATRSWQDDGASLSIEDVTPQEAAVLLRALAEWERSGSTDTEVNALVSKVCTRMTADAKTCVDRFKAEQSPEDAPDYRAVATTLVMFEAMIYLAAHLRRDAAAAEIGRQRDHYAKTALLAALSVIQRAEETTDMFVHFDIAAMLVSVENVVVVISRTIAVIDRERDQSHPFVETVSEHVVRDFANGLKRLAPTYLRMLRNATARDNAVPQFAFSVVQVLVQLARLLRILHHLLQDPALAAGADEIGADVGAMGERLRQIAAGDPDQLGRLDGAIDALGSTPEMTRPVPAAPA